MAGSYVVIDDKLQGLKCLPALVQQLSDQIDVLIQKKESARQRNKDDTEHRRPSTWAGEYLPPTRFIRMEFPRFQRSDVIRWIQECERYFELEGTPDNERVRLARKTLDEKGYIWHLAFEEEERGRRISWQRYKPALQVRFGPLNVINTGRTSTGNHGGSILRPLNGTRGVIYASRNSETEKNLRPASGVVGSFSCEPVSLTKAKSSSGENRSSILDLGETFQEKWRKDLVLSLTAATPATPAVSVRVMPLSSLSSSPKAMGRETSSHVASVLASPFLQVEGESYDSAKKLTSIWAPSPTTNSEKTTSVAAPLTTTSSLSTPSSLPSSPLASSMFELEVTIPSRNVAPAEESGASNEKLCVEAEWKELKGTWLGLVQVEKSKSQLAPIFTTWSYLADSLDALDSLNFLIADGKVGFEGAHMGPITLQLGLTIPMGIINKGLLQGVFCLQCPPTQSLLQTWFQGKLIIMLFGRIYSVSGKAKTIRGAAVVQQY